MTACVASVVEGETEVMCLPPLLHGVWRLLASPDRLQVLTPVQCKRDAFLKPGHEEFARKVADAYQTLARWLRRDPANRGILLLLLDAESDCPAEVAARLRAGAIGVIGEAAVSCVLAKRAFENWIVGGASTLGGVNGLPAPLPSRDRFEERNGAHWLETQLRSVDRARKYKKTVDAVEFVRAMDLSECHANCPSFAKLCRDLRTLIPAPPATAPADPAEDHP